MNIYKVAYNPEISAKGKKVISDNLDPSMYSDDTNQYLLEFIIEMINNLEIEIDKKDVEILTQLDNMGVEYIEF